MKKVERCLRPAARPSGRRSRYNAVAMFIMVRLSHIIENTDEYLESERPRVPERFHGPDATTLVIAGLA